MAMRLKSYQTSLGFFDLAIAAPSMKAAAEAWGVGTDEFRRGFAKQTDDPKIVAATMARPGVIMKRPVGSNGPFREHAELPKDLPLNEEKPPKRRRTGRKEPVRKLDDKAARKAVLAFEREQKQRESAHRKEEAAREKRRKRREKVVAKAERAPGEATHRHESRGKAVERKLAALDRQSQAENSRWEKQKQKLEAALRRARET